MAEIEVLRAGDEGPWVDSLQAYLNSFGASLAQDGRFGPKTEEAVKRFQAENQLVQDGVAGVKTWGKLGIEGEENFAREFVRFLQAECPTLAVIATLETEQDAHNFLRSQGIDIDALLCWANGDGDGFRASVAAGGFS